MELPHDVSRWLERYKMSREREDRTPTGKNERKKKTWKSTAENHKRVKSRKGLMMDIAGEQENLDRKPPSQRLLCGENQDSQEESQDEDPTEACCAILQTSEDEEASNTKLAITALRRPLDRLPSKKRWLRNACLEQQLDLNRDVRSDNTTSIYKMDERQTLNRSTVSSQLYIPFIDNTITDNNTTISSMDNELITPNVQLESSYISSQVCWDMNYNNESPKEAERDVYKIAHSLNQPQWNSLNTLSNNPSVFETINDESVANIQSSELGHSHFDYTEQIVHREKQDVLVKTRISENETRPTVLMLAGSSNSSKEIVSKSNDTDRIDENIVRVKEDDIVKLPIQEDNKKWLGALALMELSKAQEEERTSGLTHDIRDECSTASELSS